MAESTQTRLERSFDQLRSELRDTLSQLDRSIRGHNGEPGIAARLLILEKTVQTSDQASSERMETLEGTLQQFSQNLSKLHDELVSSQQGAAKALFDCQAERDRRTKTANNPGENPKLKTEKDSQFGSWEWFRGKIDNYAWAIIIALGSAGAVKLLDFIFKHFEGGVP